MPSGAILKVRVAPFAVSKNLYQAVLKELKQVSIKKMDTDEDQMELLKDLFCVGYSSPEIDLALEACLSHCQYNDGRADLKVDKDTFESIEAREDYITACMEVAKDNVLPFMKSLYAQSLTFMGQVGKTSQPRK